MALITGRPERRHQTESGWKGGGQTCWRWSLSGRRARTRPCRLTSRLINHQPISATGAPLPSEYWRARVLPRPGVGRCRSALGVKKCAPPPPPSPHNGAHASDCVGATRAPLPDSNLGPASRGQFGGARVEAQQLGAWPGRPARGHENVATGQGRARLASVAGPWLDSA